MTSSGFFVTESTLPLSRLKVAVMFPESLVLLLFFAADVVLSVFAAAKTRVTVISVMIKIVPVFMLGNVTSFVKF